MSISNEYIAATLEQLADLLEFQGTNPFRLRAYRNAARTIRELGESVAKLVAEGRDLTELEGVGRAVAEKCEQLIQTGRLRQLDELLDEIPVTVLDMLRVPKLGPKKAAVIFHEMGIDNLEDLKSAAEQGQLRELSGFGVKTELAILEGIEIAAAANQRMRWAEADEIVHQLRDHLKSCEAIKQLDFAGSYRRRRETVGDLDLLVDSDDATAVMDHFQNFPGINENIGRGSTKMSVRLDNGFQIDLRVVPTESFGTALQYFTGSKEHNVVIRSMAKKRKLKINEWGVYRVDADHDEYIAGTSEADVYAALDLPVYPPELRENRGEFEFATEQQLPQLIELSQIRGDLHMHTQASDGTASIAKMAEAARQRGLAYIAITDHSKRVTMANGLDERRLRAQWAEIDQINDASQDDIWIFKGVECDILEDGTLDIRDDVLAEADWVTASIHYGQNQSSAEITTRIINAIEHPSVHSISHPTGRLINKRHPYAVDLNAVFDAALANDKMLELNASPLRLDLNDLHCAQAAEMGIRIVINTDAHRPQGLNAMRYGINQARRAGLTAQQVANTGTLQQFRRLIGAD